MNSQILRNIFAGELEAEGESSLAARVRDGTDNSRGGMAALRAMEKVVAQDGVKILVDEQAKDNGLWFQPHYASEAYLQMALRRLHAAIEGKTPEQCAHELLD